MELPTGGKRSRLCRGDRLYLVRAISTTGYAYAVLQLDRLLNSYAGSGKVTVLGVGFADGVGVTDGRGGK